MASILLTTEIFSMKVLVFFIFILKVVAVQAAEIKVLNELGKPLSGVMVTQVLSDPIAMDTSDDGYAKPNTPQIRDPEFTAFTNEKGVAVFPERLGDVNYRFRKYHFEDLTLEKQKTKNIKVTLVWEKDPFKLAEQKTSNIWLGALEIGTVEDKKIFQMQCGYCHQQGSSFTRQERNPEDWENTIKRMVRYGSRLPTDLQKTLPTILQNSYRKLREHPELLVEPNPWDENLKNLLITEWPIGDMMSQTHDMLFASNKMVYVADNIQDRVYEVNPKTNQVTVYKIPHLDGDTNGGLISGRLKDFPRHDSTMNAHSLAESMVDGHIFITPSAQRRLVEFDPASKKFTIYQMKDGFYPHTIRIDQKDNVWFTLALSNQVAKFDRKTKEFTYYDLPARNFKEKMIVNNIGLLFRIMSWGVPLSNWLKIDREFTGTPLVYGIDITPDGTVWFARLHTQEIGSINPVNGEIKLIKTPFKGPRRLRTDSFGNLWIVGFADSVLSRYNPKDNTFKQFDLPVNPKGSETPYSLNVDKKRNVVWVTGNQSDSLYGLDVQTEKWRQVPLPRRTTFTRDIEIAEDGTLYTSNSNFPSWHIEDSQPSLIQISPR